MLAEAILVDFLVFADEVSGLNLIPIKKLE